MGDSPPVAVRPVHAAIPRAWLLLVGLLVCCPAAARELTGFRPVGPDLPHKTVHAILQDSAGFIWVATPDGLNRFDGYEFVTWRHEPDRRSSLSSSLVFSLVEDSQGWLWAGTSNGLNRVNRRTGSVERDQILADTDQRTGSVFALLEQGGSLWAGTENGLFRRDRHRWRALDLSEGAPAGADNPPVLGLAGREDTVYALARIADPQSVRVVRIDPRQGRHRWLQLPPEQGPIYALGVSGPNEVWVDTAGPLSESGGALAGLGSQGQPIWSFAETANGQVWLGTEGGLVDGSSAERKLALVNPSPRAYLSNFVRSVLVDDAGELWLGTFDGLYRSLPAFRPFRHLGYWPDRADSLSTAAVASVLEDSRGRLWVGTYGGGLNRIDPDGSVDHWTDLGGTHDRLENAIVWDLAEDCDGRLLIGTPSGLYRLNPESGSSHRIPALTASGWPNVRQIRTGPDSIWLGTFDGLMRYEPDERLEQVWPPADSDVTDRHIESMELDGRLIWAGTGGRTLVRMDSQSGQIEVRSFPADFDGASIWDLHRRRDGSLLMGTGGGLMVLGDNGELTRFDESLRPAGTSVFGIAEDSENRLWLGTNLGLVRVDPDPGTVHTYRATDGTGNTEYNRHAVRRLSNGELAFGGMDGLTRFDPTAIGENFRPPRLAITKIEVHSINGVRQLGTSETLDLSHSDYTFAVEFAALDYADPKNNQYRYRLLGFDRAWVEAGTRRRATYTSIPAGRYRLEIQGSNNDDVWNREGIALSVRIAPPYWETWWFRSLVAAALIALVALIYRLRVGHLLRLERVRLQIAGDLHDEIGSDLSGIAIASDVVRRELKPGKAGQEHLKEISSIALRTADNLRDIVWYINPDHDRGRSLRQRMQATAQSMLAELDYRLEFDRAVDQSALDMQVRRNIHLVFKEALNNIYRHSGAGAVEIRARSVDGHFELEVSDNGQGFDPSAETAGTGLANMRKRLTEIGGTFEITSSESGTRIIARVPLPKTRDGQRDRFRLRR